MIWGAELHGANEHSKSLQFAKHRIKIQSLRKMDNVVIEDYDHMTTMNENMNWMELTHSLSISLRTLRPLCVHLPLIQNS